MSKICLCLKPRLSINQRVRKLKSSRRRRWPTRISLKLWQIKNLLIFALKILQAIPLSSHSKLLSPERYKSRRNYHGKILTNSCLRLMGGSSRLKTSSKFMSIRGISWNVGRKWDLLGQLSSRSSPPQFLKSITKGLNLQSRSLRSQNRQEGNSWLKSLRRLPNLQR